MQENKILYYVINQSIIGPSPEGKYEYCDVDNSQTKDNNMWQW